MYNYSVDYDIVKECSENFVEYIKDRNTNIDNRIGLKVKYSIEFYDNVINDYGTIKYKNWDKRYF